ncbi:MAG: BolA family protein [Gammaproteobacteria bacterium]
MQIEKIRELIEQGLPGCVVKIDGDGAHFEAVIISDVFAGKTLVAQHQLVYQCLGEKMGTDIHALSMQTYTPEEWEKKKNLRVI